MKKKPKEMIYFLEWIYENYGIEPNDFLNNCRPENNFLNNGDIFEKYMQNGFRWMMDAFLWEKSQCVEHLGITIEHNKYKFFLEIDNCWMDILESYPHENIKFSRYKINDFKVIEDEFKLHFE